MGSNGVALGFSLWAEDQQQTQKDTYYIWLSLLDLCKPSPMPPCVQGSMFSPRLASSSQSSCFRLSSVGITGFDHLNLSVYPGALPDHGFKSRLSLPSYTQEILLSSSELYGSLDNSNF